MGSKFSWPVGKKAARKLEEREGRYQFIDADAYGKLRDAHAGVRKVQSAPDLDFKPGFWLPKSSEEHRESHTDQRKQLTQTILPSSTDAPSTSPAAESR
jgi:hypothetical protein